MAWAALSNTKAPARRGVLNDPNTHFLQRAAVWFLALLPIEGLL